MIKRIDKDDQNMIEQELLSPLKLNDHGENEEENKNKTQQDMKELDDISNMLIKEQMEGIDIEIPSDLEMENEQNNIGHKHVRSRHSMLSMENEVILPQDLGLDINALDGANHHEMNLSEDGISNLSGNDIEDAEDADHDDNDPQIVQDID